VATADSSLAIRGGPPLIPVNTHRAWPQLEDSDRDAVLAVLDRGVLCGASAPQVVGLQKEWARYCGARHCLATNSGTAALHCAVAAAGVRPGDEVIVPALTFIASAYAIAHQGAIPVFCDIDPRTYNIDPEAIESLVTGATKAIMPVHLHGLPSDMEQISTIARRHRLVVIEDAAQAHGAQYHGRRVGIHGHCAAFSLNATKMLVGGEGGLFVTDDEEAHQVACRLALFGEDARRARGGGSSLYESHGVGWNYRCPELAAALARAQLTRLDDAIARASENATILNSGLASIKGLQPPLVPADRTCAWHKYRLAVDWAALGFDPPYSGLRDKLIRALLAEGVSAGTWQDIPVPANPAFSRGALEPWHAEHCCAEHESWDSGRYPVTSSVLEQSLIVGLERTPICAQNAELMHCYVDAFVKVFDHLEAALLG
jgi:perosamine synthetase